MPQRVIVGADGTLDQEEGPQASRRDLTSPITPFGWSVSQRCIDKRLLAVPENRRPRQAR
jgi:hypothetical protein